MCIEWKFFKVVWFESGFRRMRKMEYILLSYGEYFFILERVNVDIIRFIILNEK